VSAYHYNIVTWY